MDENETWVGKEDRPHKHLQRCDLILDYGQWFLINDLEIGCKQASLLSRAEVEIGHQRFVHCIVHLEREQGLCHFFLPTMSEGIHDLDL